MCKQGNKEFCSKINLQQLNTYFNMGEIYFFIIQESSASQWSDCWNIDFCLTPWVSAIISTYQWKTEDKSDQCLMLQSTSVVEFIPVCSLKPQIYSLYMQSIHIHTDVLLRCLYIEKGTYAHTHVQGPITCICTLKQLAQLW